MNTDKEQTTYADGIDEITRLKNRIRTLQSERDTALERVKELDLALAEATSHGLTPELPFIGKYEWEDDEEQAYRVKDINPHGDGTVLFWGSDEISHPENCPNLAKWIRERAALSTIPNPSEG